MISNESSFVLFISSKVFGLLGIVFSFLHFKFLGGLFLIFAGLLIAATVVSCFWLIKQSNRQEEKETDIVKKLIAENRLYSIVNLIKEKDLGDSK